MKMSTGWERIRLRVETNQLETEQALEAEMMNETRTISSHVLDTSLGKAAANIPITLFRWDGHDWHELGKQVTNEDGRVNQFLSTDQFQSGIYKLHFDVHSYFEAKQLNSFYPFIEIVIECRRGQHYHVPLLLNPFGYSTYRGT